MKTRETDWAETMQAIREAERAPLLRLVSEMQEEIEVLKERLCMLQDTIARAERRAER